MVGIADYGIYIPVNRLDRKVLAEAFNKTVSPGEKAVANYDEDSITMSVAAAIECMNDKDVSNLGAVFFATTTSPYKEKQGAAVISAVLDVKRHIRTADFTDSLRAGSSAMLSAIDAATLGTQTLVAVGDCRLGAPDGENEINFGDGAAALLLSDKDVIAKVVGSYSVAVDFHDAWRSDSDVFVRNWEERFCVTQGYIPFVVAAVEGVLEKTKLKPDQFAKIVNYGATERYQIDVAVRLMFKHEQIQNGFFNAAGNMGAAHAFVMLASALDEAKPGDKLLLVTYGEGCDAIVLEVTEAIQNRKNKRTVRQCLEHKKPNLSYTKYLRWRNLLHFEPPRRPEQRRSSQPDYFRKYKKNHALYGCRCKKCGTPQFPKERVCANCGTVDQMEDYKFLGRRAKIATFTMDYLTVSHDPPLVIVILDFDGGGRLMTTLIDCDFEKVAVGMPVYMSYRRIFTAEGAATYFWKAIPVTEGERS
jgi:3-hydroxy-3-methylglutaryl CoA synthase